MGTRRRYRKHRGGDPFIPDLTATGPAAKEREKKRYEAWLAKRKVEAVEDYGLEKIKQDRSSELKSLAGVSPVKARIQEEQEKEASRRRAEKEASNPCITILKSAGVSGKTSSDLRKSVKKFALKNHPDKGGDKENFQKVYGCYEKKLAYLETKGAGRRTRRRKSRRRR
jgi:hypothetical protein